MDEMKKIPIIPLKNTVLLPKNIIPVVVGRPFSVKALEAVLNSEHKEICITLQKRDIETNLISSDIYTIGTKAIILQAIKIPKGSYKLLLEGISRVEIKDIEKKDDFFIGQMEDFKTDFTINNLEFKARWNVFYNIYKEYILFLNKAPDVIVLPELDFIEAETIVDLLSAQLSLKFQDKQKVLEEASLIKRIEFLTYYISEELEVIKTEEKIKDTIQKQIEQGQKEYYLNEQLKAIQKELKKEKQGDFVTEDYKKKLDKQKLSKEAYDKCLKEINKLEMMQVYSSEASVSRNYIEWILAIPWKKISKDSISLELAIEILNTDHFGLDSVKERIIEYIAAKKYAKNSLKNPIICLVGPPGVGKTSLATSIAKSLNREFIKIALGGVRDEAEIRGHRKTYIASMPGRIIQGLKKASTINPVFLLDEIDKIGHDAHGDPSSALLEVLDFEQNKEFVDHYLEIPYDLSNVFFIATANHLETIPYPLLDRMELIFLSGYTKEEKLNIAEQFILKKKMTEHNLTNKDCLVTREALKLLIDDYTKEAGVRSLERLITRMLRKCIGELLEKKEQGKPIIIDEKKIVEYFKTGIYKNKLISDIPIPGLVNGLAWTEVGGEALQVEVSIVPGKGNLTLTGQLGEVMQESAQTALSFVRSLSEKLGIKKTFFANYDIHIHIPEGATPKDGPSAGITICSALISAITQIPIKPFLAMTGEITLQGRVLAVGGLKEKFLAAHYNYLKEVIVPFEHKELAQDALKEIKQCINLIFVQHMNEVIEYAFVKNPFKKIKKRKEAKT